MWVGEDVPDFQADKPPTYRPEADARGWTRFLATARSSCRATGSAGCLPPWASRMDHSGPLRAGGVAGPGLLYERRRDPAARLFDVPTTPTILRRTRGIPTW